MTSGEAMSEKSEKLTERSAIASIADAGLWIVPYVSMMTILAVFFMVLYAYTFLAYKGADTETEVVISRIEESMLGRPTVSAQEVRAAKTLEAYIAAKGLKQFAQVAIDARRVKVIFSLPVLFRSGQGALSDGTKGVLKEVARLLRELPNPVSVEGHTDDVPPSRTSQFPTNWELSAARAFSVVRYFQEEGLDPWRFSARGFGEWRPLYPNTSPENRALNRRIEVSILRGEVAPPRYVRTIRPKDVLQRMRLHHFYAIAAWKKRDFSAARREFGEILKLDPKHEQSRRMLERIAGAERR